MEAKRNSMLMIVIILCTITVIGTNYTFNKQSIIDINNSIMENEYKKIGGKDNYILLQEIQKREILTYLSKIREEQPELIEEISKQKDENNKYKFLSENIINDLKKDTSIKGNSDAIISIIEFSDLECPFCIKSHNEGTNEKILEKYKGKVNFIFKNFPLPIHENAKTEAIASKCVESIAGGDKYFEYIDDIFEMTKGGGKGFNTDELIPLAEKNKINIDEFKSCLSENKTKEQVEKEFNQGRMLEINSVPSSLILNNKTGKYIILSESKNDKEFIEIIEEISK